MIIFDFDGTLADSFGWFSRNINKAARKFNFRTVESADHHHLRYHDSQEVMRYLKIPFWKVPFIARYMKKLMNKELHLISLFKDIEMLLRDLSAQKIPIAIVSSNSRDNVIKILGDNVRHIQYFECGVSLQGKRSKFLKILKRAGVAPEDVLCVGDEIRDITAAKAAKLSAGSVTWGYAHLEALQKARPHHIFHSVQEIKELF